MERRICQAIEERHTLTFEYEAGTYVVEPFLHGISTAGHESVRAFQVGGDDHSGQEEKWKLFRLDRIHHLHITQDKFSDHRAGYNPQDHEMATIHCSVTQPVAEPH